MNPASRPATAAILLLAAAVAAAACSPARQHGAASAQPATNPPATSPPATTPPATTPPATTPPATTPPATTPPATTPPATTPPATIQPGAPGAASRPVDAAAPVQRTARASLADVAFMQGMIVHHAQAVDMTALVRDRTDNAHIRLLARRIEASQDDELALMRRWLSARSVSTAGEHAQHGHAAHMPGMLSPEQLARLESARGAAFDRLFLELMIVHHEGALVMVQQLFASEGGGQDIEIFDFASHVDADQRMEIARMRSLLRSLDAGG